MKSGVIFDIKEFAVYDGPGLRQTVFFKGCPLRCNWCHNPEGLEKFPQIMGTKIKCLNCGVEQVTFNNICINCKSKLLADIKICGEVITSEKLVEKIIKNDKYYSKYGGGVTFSGGEPLMQGEFLLEVLNKIPNIHKTIETSGYCTDTLFNKVIDKLDLVIMDIKIVNSDKHKIYTGVGNEIIFKNLNTLCDIDKQFIVRIPVIPGINDNEDDFEYIANLLKDANNLEKVEFLPYHKTAGAKYIMLNEKYEPKFDINRKVLISQNKFTEYGIRSEII